MLGFRPLKKSTVMLNETRLCNFVWLVKSIINTSRNNSSRLSLHQQAGAIPGDDSRCQRRVGLGGCRAPNEVAQGAQ
jgi:hypothetical protein